MGPVNTDKLDGWMNGCNTNSRVLIRTERAFPSSHVEQQLQKNSL